MARTYRLRKTKRIQDGQVSKRFVKDWVPDAYYDLESVPDKWFRKKFATRPERYDGRYVAREAMKGNYEAEPRLVHMPWHT